MLEADPSLVGRGIAAERDSVEEAKSRMGEALQRAITEWREAESVMKNGRSEKAGANKNAPTAAPNKNKSSDISSTDMKERPADRARGWTEVERLEKDLALLGASKKSGQEAGRLEEEILASMEELGILATGSARALLSEVFCSCFSPIRSMR